MIRPQPARWFEAVCARDDAFVLLESLAAAGCAEIQWHGAGEASGSAAANAHLKDFAALARRYRPYWPRPELREPTAQRTPLAAFEHALGALRAWAGEAGPAVESLQGCEAEIGDLDVLARALEALEASGIGLARLARATGPLGARVLSYPAGAEPPIPPAVLVLRFVVAHAPHAVVVGPADTVAALEREALALHGRAVTPPSWLAAGAEAAGPLLHARRQEREGQRAALREEIAASLRKHSVALALGDIARAAWCFHNAGAVEGTPALARVSGWTDDPARLSAAVHGSGSRALVAFPAAPRDAQAPLLLRNPAWARPFEIFVRLFGVPAREGVDPTLVVAVASPLLFGYMFGDLGQGLLLAAAGLLLQRRWPALKLLVPGGLAAAAFGLAFGCVFLREDLIAPLWVAPLSAPLAILTVPLYAGAALLSVGLGLRALEAWWNRQAARWLRREAGLLAVYAGVLLAPFHSAGLVVAAAGALAFVAGHALEAGRASAAATALGELLERTLQILVNTVSFARVGAFALAHAGLAAAVAALAHAAGGGLAGLAVLVAGNALVIGLEGLVVGIQTTRLILFEFFARFLDGGGREFRPLRPPETTEVLP